MKRIFALALTLVLALSLTACGGTKTETPSASSGSAAASSTAEPANDRSTVSKIAVLLPGSITDESWNQTAYEGLM